MRQWQADRQFTFQVVHGMLAHRQDWFSRSVLLWYDRYSEAMLWWNIDFEGNPLHRECPFHPEIRPRNVTARRHRALDDSYKDQSFRRCWFWFEWIVFYRHCFVFLASTIEHCVRRREETTLLAYVYFDIATLPLVFLCTSTEFYSLSDDGASEQHPARETERQSDSHVFILLISRRVSYKQRQMENAECDEMQLLMSNSFLGQSSLPPLFQIQQYLRQRPNRSPDRTSPKLPWISCEYSPWFLEALHRPSPWSTSNGRSFVSFPVQIQQHRLFIEEILHLARKGIETDLRLLR